MLSPNLSIVFFGKVGIGDTVFWVLLPTIFGGIAAYSALEYSMTGVFIMLAYALAIFLIRIRFFRMGYDAGQKVITKFGKELNIFTEACSVLGLTVVGALIPSVISVKTPITFTSGEITTELQATLNSIMPGMIPILLTAISYFLLNKKKVKMTSVILWTLIVSFVAYALGILA